VRLPLENTGSNASVREGYSHLSVEYKRQAVAKLPKLETNLPTDLPTDENAKVVGFRK